MRKILLGATVLAAAATAFVVGPAQAAYNGTNCSGYGTPGADPVSVATPLATGETGDSVVGVCVSAAGRGGVLEVGGDVRDQENRLCFTDNPVTLTTTDIETTVPAGVYVVADGHDANPGQTLGYVGLSNYESNADTEDEPPGGDTSCEPENGGGTNSGGSVGVTQVEVGAEVDLCNNAGNPDPTTGGGPDGDSNDTCTFTVLGTPVLTIPERVNVITVPVGVYAPVPFVACGNDSGPTWNDSGRDGCFFDNSDS